MIRMGKTFLCAVLLSAAVSIGEGHGLAKVERAQGEGAEAAAGQAYAAAGHSFPLLKLADGAGGNGRLSGGQAGEAQTAGRSGRTAELEKAALSGDRSGEEQRGGTSGERAGAAQPDKPGKQPVEQPERTVYLTFDDGPGKHTPEVLDVLQAAGVKGTFFMLGKYVELHPDIVRRIVKEGHGVGNHTYDHVYDKLYGGFDAFAEQVLATEDAIYAAAGVRTELVRAPGGTFGNFDEGYFRAMDEAGFRLHDWNVDSGDSKGKEVTAEEIMGNIKASPLKDKLVVLLHDGGDRQATVQALPAIIDYYNKLGYAFGVLNGDTEPVRFAQASKLKWTRPAVTGGQIAAFKEAAYAQRRSQTKDEPVLVIHAADKDVRFEASDYRLAKGVLYVPLDVLTEGLGGSVAPLPDGSGYEAALDGGTYRFSGDELGLPEQEAEARPQDNGAGAAYVPLRKALDRYGLQIYQISFNGKERNVWAKWQEAA